MSKGEVYYMYIISHTCSVVRIIVVSEYTKLLKLSDSHLCNVRHQVVWNSVGVLSHCPALVCPDWVKVAQKDDIPFRVCLLHVCKNLLQHGFCPSIWVGTLAFRAFLGDGNKCRIPIHGCR